MLPLVELSRCSSLARLYAALALLQLIPVWAVPFLPYQDGPSHLYNSMALREWLLGNESFRSIYSLHLGSASNWIDHVTLGILGAVVSPDTAEKLMVSAYLLIFAASARYAVPLPFAYLLLPLAYNAFLHWGFYNFALSIPVFLIAFGFLTRHPVDTDLRQGLGHALLALLLALCHPFSAWLWGLLRIVHGLCLARDERWMQLGRISLSLVPAAAVTLLGASSASSGADTSWPLLTNLLRGAIGSSFLWSYEKADLARGLVLTGILTAAGIAVLRGRKRNRWDPLDRSLAICAGLYFALYFVLPNQWHSFGFINKRTLCFAAIVLIFLYSRRGLTRRVQVVVLAASILLCVGQIARNTITYRRIADHAASHVACVTTIPEGSSLLVDFEGPPKGVAGSEEEGVAWQVDFLISAAGRPAAARRLILLSDYEGYLPYFPLGYRFTRASRPLPDYVLTRASTGWPGYDGVCSSGANWRLYRRPLRGMRRRRRSAGTQVTPR
jgi:hypothetical protein